MPEAEDKESYLELFDVSKKAQVAKVPLANVKHMPRKDERIFIKLHNPGDWDAYRVVAIEYFVGASEGRPEALAMVRVTLYVEESK